MYFSSILPIVFVSSGIRIGEKLVGGLLGHATANVAAAEKLLSCGAGGTTGQRATGYTRYKSCRRGPKDTTAGKVYIRFVARILQIGRLTTPRDTTGRRGQRVQTKRD